MSTLTDDELTKLAIQELLKDAKRFQERRDAEFRATQMKRPMKTNKPFLKNTLRDVLSFNKKKTERNCENIKNANRNLLNKGISHKFVVSKKEQSNVKKTEMKEIKKNCQNDKYCKK